MAIALFSPAVILMKDEGDCNLTGFDTMSPPASWDTSRVTDMRDLVASLGTCNPDVDSWQVDAVTDVRGMFDGAASFNQPLDSWKVNEVVSMASMLFEAKEFNQPLNS